ncbi:excisionase [Aliikangiella coralliicola]|uniref:Excisionase n=1 Tax=Aliikangiella coralliicola TaxID=2592383 RepID=A0A545U024_9GAMM|nr:excisionase [Aliikangiella coralliicola]TQV82815.1 excisionase [Aliikangiella coralliicola]
MKITLQEWDKQEFSVRHSMNTLRAWATSGLIQPAPLKIGGRWMVESYAQYVPPKVNNNSGDPIVDRILKSVS